MFADTLTLSRYPTAVDHGAKVLNLAASPTVMAVLGCDAQPGAAKGVVEYRDTGQVAWTVWAPGGADVRSLDRATLNGGTVVYAVMGDPERWGDGSGNLDHVVVQLRRADNWFDTTVVVKSYQGSSGFGPSWAAPATWPASIVSTSGVDVTAAGDEPGPQVSVRVPWSLAGAVAVDVFTPNSILTVAGVDSVVASVQPVTRDGVVEFVEVTAR
jgi:hypothetical protein